MAKVSVFWRWIIGIGLVSLLACVVLGLVVGNYVRPGSAQASSTPTKVAMTYGGGSTSTPAPTATIRPTSTLEPTATAIVLIVPTATRVTTKGGMEVSFTADAGASNVCDQTYVANLFGVDPTKLSAPGWGCPEGKMTGAWVFSNEANQVKVVIVPVGTAVDHHCVRYLPGQSLTVGVGEKASFHFFPTQGSPNSVGVGCGNKAGEGAPDGNQGKIAPVATPTAAPSQAPMNLHLCTATVKQVEEATGVVGGWVAPDWGWPQPDKTMQCGAWVNGKDGGPQKNFKVPPFGCIEKYGVKYCTAGETIRADHVSLVAK